MSKKTYFNDGLAKFKHHDKLIFCEKSINEIKQVGY